MEITATELPGVMVVQPKVHGDARGFFLETWNRERYAQLGLKAEFVQDNLSFSRRGTLRGLHFQNPRSQGKLVYVLQGEVYDVAVDIRHDSPNFGRWVGVTLSGENKRQIYLPPGFAHGFCVISETALFAYKCTAAYHRDSDWGIAWNDPELAIGWPMREPLLSEKDRLAPRLRDLPREKLTFAAC